MLSHARFTPHNIASSSHKRSVLFERLTRLCHTSKMGTRLAVILGCLPALFVSACGGGTDSAGDARVDEIAAILAEDYNEDDGLVLTDDQIRCLAGEVVAGLDDDVIDEVFAEKTLDDPPPGAELVVLDSLFSCASVTQLMTDSMVADGATQAEAECFADGFDENLIRAMLTSELTGEDPSPEDEAALTAAAIEVMTTCDS